MTSRLCNQIFIALQNKYRKSAYDALEHVTPTADSVLDVHLQTVRHLPSVNHYAEAAKRNLDKYNVDADMIQIAHAVHKQPLASQNLYQLDHVRNDRGRGVSGAGVQFYPLYVKARQSDRNLSQVAF